ncbi:MAG: BamA/TamA family outer membrane protein [Deltaproteobacteria bacterium]|nr:BamA/TamA family outer membrane protein [Deltaproteobacteria bacterium]
MAVDEKPVDTIESSRVLLRFTVVEGIQYRVGEVTIQGNLRTDPAIILSEMRLQKGDLFSPSLLKQSEENIGLLGIFSKVEMVAHSSLTDPRSKDIKIAVTESKPGIGEIGMGAAYEAPLLRLRSFVGIAKRNLFGRNHTVSLRGELTVPIMNDRFAPFLEYATVLGLRSPNPFQIPAIFTASLGVDRFVQTVTPSGTSITNYTLVDRARLEERLEKKITDHTTLSYRIHHFEKTVTYDSATRLEQAPETIGSIGPGIIIDRRDDTFNPTIGSYHSFDVEFAHPALFSSANIEFVMGISRNSFYLPFIFGTALKIYVGLGYARSIDPNDSLPQIRLANDLALGGQNSIRGYLPRSIKAPYPGTYDMAFYNARGEVSFPIFGDFSAAVFADTGQLFDNVGFPGSRLMDPQDYRTRRDGVGVGFRYKTPVGPFVVDFAEGLGQANPTIQFYFTLGTL